MRAARVLARLGLAGLLVLLAVRALGAERGTLLVLLVGALPLVLLPAYPLLGAALLVRSRRGAALAAAAVVGHLAVVAPALGAAPLPPGQAPALRVVTANLYVLNPDPERTGRALRALRPDVLVVSEVTEQGRAALERSGLLADLPHGVVPLADRPEGVALLSRLPLTDVDLARLGPRLLPRATVQVQGRPVRVLAAHPLPPAPGWERLWRAALRALADEVSAEPLPPVVAGDLNADRDHAPFRALLRAGLRDAHDVRGRGLARTWPASRPLLHLDHVLVGRGLGVRQVREARLPGSDHLAVVADLAVLR